MSTFDTFSALVVFVFIPTLCVYLALISNKPSTNKKES